jgi:hypothetical protein
MYTAKYTCLYTLCMFAENVGLEPILLGNFSLYRYVEMSLSPASVRASFKAPSWARADLAFDDIGDDCKS